MFAKYGTIKRDRESLCNLSIPSELIILLIESGKALHSLRRGLVGQFLDDALDAVRDDFPGDLTDNSVS